VGHVATEAGRLGRGEAELLHDAWREFVRDLQEPFGHGADGLL
jgi:hypothetical protein